MHVRVFYCDHFVLPLPAEHSFPMAKYRLTRERIVADGLVAAEEVSEARGPSWEEIRLVHTAEYADAVRSGTVARLDTCRSAGVPVAVTMAGGYAPDVDAIVRIHTATIGEAARASRVLAEPA